MGYNFSKRNGISHVFPELYNRKEKNNGLKKRKFGYQW
jgi:hypothetical protein